MRKVGLYRFWGWVLVAWLGLSSVAVAQPKYGVVWHPPADPQRAAADLTDMAKLGVNAVRTSLITDASLLIHADTLGLALYQEVDLAYVPAAFLADTLAVVQRQLAPVLARAHQHPSIRHIGVMRFADTSDPRARAFLQTLIPWVRSQAPSDLQIYYISAFIEEDVAAGGVDFVLLSALDDPDPMALLQRWRVVHQTPVGLAAVGYGLVDGAERGYRVPHSPEAQARYLEEHLPRLQADPAEPVFFLHRWRDRADDSAAYGLLEATGGRRPAYEVVAGLFTGRQSVFAFPAGEAPSAPFPWRIGWFWVMVLLLGIIYASEPKFRQTIPRYLWSHRFYQDAVRENRLNLNQAHIVLFFLQLIAIALIGAVLMEGLQTTRAWPFLMHLLPDRLAAWLRQQAEPRLWMGAAWGVGYTVLVGLRALGLVGLARRRRLRFSQAITLILWPRWILFFLALYAVCVLLSSGLIGFGGVLLLWFLTAQWAWLRTLRDAATVRRVPVWQSGFWGGAWWWIPLGILLLYTINGWPILTFGWHLLTRT